jgi:Tol biopolymer transport system component
MASDNDTLESWKEIAAYLKRDVTTVQRWEKREGLPVHRHVHDKSGSVFAQKPELDRWRRARTRPPDAPPEPSEDADAVPEPDPARELPPIEATPAAPAPSAAWRRPLLFGLALSAMLVTVGGLQRTATRLPAVPVAFAVTPADGRALVPNEAPVISPDGRSLVFVAMDEDGTARLWLRPIDDVSTRPLPGTEGARYPFWSADSRQVAFFSDGRLRAVAIRGGEPRAICEAPYGQAGAWGADGVILFPLTTQSGLYRVRMEGGTPVPVTAPDRAAGDFAHRAPHFLPDGRRFIFFVKSTRPDREGIWVGTFGSTSQRYVMRSLSEAWHVAGHLLIVQPPALMAVPIDPHTLAQRGAPIVLTREAQHDNFSARGLFSASDTGTIVYSTVRTPEMRVVRIERDGRRSGTDIRPGVFWDLARAPDGASLAMTRLSPDGNRDIWQVDLASQRTDRLTTDAADDAMPVWSPDGRQMAFSSRRLGTIDVFVQDIGGTGAPTPLVAGPGDQWVNHWSSDGRYVLYSATRAGNDTRSDLFVLDLQTRTSMPVVQTRGRDTQARFSPDGRWIAYSCDARGQPDIFVRPFPARGDEEHLVSVGGGGYPRWRPDGRELFYVDGPGNLVAVAIATAPTVRIGAADVVARGVFARLGPTISGVGADYAVAPDGQSFFVKEPIGPVAGPITVRLHVFSGAGGE